MAEEEAADVVAATTQLARMRIVTRVAPGAPHSIPIPCRYFLGGFCANGSACRFEHPEPTRSTPPPRTTVASNTPSPPPPSRPFASSPLAAPFAPSPSFAPPRPSDFAVRRAAANTPPRYVGFSAAYASIFDDDDDDTDALLRAASAPATAAPSFLTSVQAANNSTYAAAAASDDTPHMHAAHGSNTAINPAPPAPSWGVPPTCIAAATSSPGSSGASSSSPVLLSRAKLPGALCRYHVLGDCRYGDRCRYIHGTRCDICGQNALHPTDAAEVSMHTDACGRELERKERVKRSEHVECGICYERPAASGRKFGLLQNCDHAFCLSCIREWRGAESVGTFGREAVRVCPVCRTESFLVIPSDTYESNKSVRENLLARYKQKLSSIPCKHFDYGRAECPFAASCMYAHVDLDGNPVAAPDRPRLLVSDSGVRVKTHARLSDYLPPAR